MRRLGTFALAFTLGACVSAAATSVAAPDSAAPEPSVSEPAVAPDAQGFVAQIERVEHRTSPNGAAEIAMLARGNNAFVGLLRMNGGGAVPQHRDETEEYIYVLEGGGTITIDGTASSLSPGSIVYMPANAEVSYENGPEPLVALQVFAGPQPASKYDRWVTEGGPQPPG